MKVLFVVLNILYFSINTTLLAQTKPLRVEKNIEKYLNQNLTTVADKPLKVLIRTNTSLSTAQLQKIRPLKVLAPTYYVVDGANLQDLPTASYVTFAANNLWKLSDELMKSYERNPTSKKELALRIAFKQWEASAELRQTLVLTSVDTLQKIATVIVAPKNLQKLLENEEVVYVDLQAPKAKTEVVINGIDLAVNEVSEARNLYSGIDGTGVNLSIKEDLFDELDLDLLGKNLPNAAASNTVTAHATTMATLAVGSGNSFLRGLGVAPSAKLSSSSFSNIMPDDIATLSARNIQIQNHSYGTTIENVYGIEAAACDRQIYDADTLVHVFSAGNVGTSTPSAGVYQGLAAQANLTGNFKQAKNLLVIGGINRENVSEDLSSRGPAYDGRIKPELVALGQDGTSGSAAITSGSVVLLEQMYRQKFNVAPSAALVKAVMINAADDLGRPGPDYIYGYGKVNITQSLKTIDENRAAVYDVNKDEVKSVALSVPDNVAEIKVTVAWNDPPAEINATASLINHLALQVQDASGSSFLPWVLSSFPHADSLVKNAERKVDLLNNVQQVSIENPSSGIFQVQVNGAGITQGNQQRFALAYSYKLKNQFQFSSPVQEEGFYADEGNYIRWKNTLSASQGSLSVSFDGGVNWQLINAQINLSTGFYLWNVPDVFSRALLKMEIAGQMYLSQSFIVSKARTLKVGYACTHGAFLYWNKQDGAKDYTLYGIVDNKLQALATTADTILRLNADQLSGQFFAVGANGVDFSGLKSYTINYTQQGVSCYTRQFFASITENNQVRLDLNIGTTADLKNIIWEKLTAVNTFTALQQTTVVGNQLQYSILDANPKKGIQYYRVTYETTFGRVISDLVSVVFLQEDEFSIYPNPVSDFLTVLSGSFSDYSLSVVNMLGQKVFEQVVANSTNRFDLSQLSTGVYVVIITRNGQQLKKIKLIKS